MSIAIMIGSILTSKVQILHRKKEWTAIRNNPEITMVPKHNELTKLRVMHSTQ